MRERELECGSKECRNIQLFADMLNNLSTKDVFYQVQDTYLDYGQGWRWTTVIAYRGESHWQAITPAEWKRIVAAKSVVEVAQLVEEHFRDKYCSDKMREF